MKLTSVIVERAVPACDQEEVGFGIFLYLRAIQQDRGRVDRRIRTSSVHVRHPRSTF